MVIGIHSIAAFKKQRTGVEEYAFQLIRHLAMLPEAKEHRFLLYSNRSDNFNFDLPENFEIRKLSSFLLWTQFRLSLEMLKKECDVLFIPAHVLPIIHPKNSVVAIHGLEYEYFPEYYPFLFRKYLRWSTKYATRNAKKIIAVSNNTKRDLVKLYGVNEEKIEVVYHGTEFLISPKADASHRYGAGNFQFLNKSKIQNSLPKVGPPRAEKSKILKYILYIGRIELKKNIVGIIKTFEIFKKKYRLPHRLVLAGPNGYGYEKIKFSAQGGSAMGGQDSIILSGYVNNKEKEWLYNNASLFLFPSFYEGFGMPILEAQARGVPVITSNISSMPEIGGDGALYVDPNNYNDIADKIYKLLTDENLKQDIINKGFENIKKFNWENCARETLKILTEK